MSAKAAAALSNLAIGNAANKDRIREDGGLFALCALLKNGAGPIAVPKAAEALRSLAANSPDNKVGIRWAGGIPLLVDIFKPTLTRDPSTVVRRRGAAPSLP